MRHALGVTRGSDCDSGHDVSCGSGSQSDYLLCRQTDHLPGYQSQGGPPQVDKAGERNGSVLKKFPVPELNAATAYEWERVENLGEYPLPAPHRRLLEKWGNQIARFCEKTK